MEGKPAKIVMDEKGRLLDEKGREIKLDSSQKYTFDVNVQKYSKKNFKANRYLQQSQSEVKSRGTFFDENLPKKKRKLTKSFLFNGSVKLRADTNPDVEWWDKPLVTQSCFLTEDNREQITSQVQNLPYTEACSKAKCLLENLLPEVHYNKEEITAEVQESSLGEGQTLSKASHSQMMHLTPKERKKLRRLKRQKSLNELREKIKLGLVEPPPEKVKLSTVMKVMAKEIALDPSKTEQDIMEKYNQRIQQHFQRNEEKKLTKAQRQERSLRKLRRDSARETRTAVFKMESITNGKTKFKLQKNAEQLALVGVGLVLPEGPSLVVVEGGKRAIKFYKRLCLHRIDWTLEKGPCSLLWEAEIKDSSFKNFKLIDCETEHHARKILSEHSVESFLNLLKSGN